MRKLFLIVLLPALIGCEQKSFDQQYRESSVAQVIVDRSYESLDKVDALAKTLGYEFVNSETTCKDVNGSMDCISNNSYYKKVKNR